MGIIMNKEIFKFAQFDEFYRCYRPLTPHAKLLKEERRFVPSRKEAEKEFDLIEKTIAFVNASPDKASKAEYHLKKIPVADFFGARTLNSSEIYLVKKLIFNYRHVLGTLPAELARSLDMEWEFGALAGLLEKGGGRQAFCVSDAYSPLLKDIREKLEVIDGELRKKRGEIFRKIKKDTGLDFFFREFAVVDSALASRIRKKDFIHLEPYDSIRVIAKPAVSARVLGMMRRRQKLLAEEKKIENGVVLTISGDIKKEARRLEKCQENLARLDCLLAKAKLAIRFSMTRPSFSRGGAVRIKKGRFLPLKEMNESYGLGYEPLDAKFPGNATVLRGSNMGGKTSVLKTVCFMQILAQMGFFVPAEKFSTGFYDDLRAIANPENIRGLSSFASEICALISALERPGRKMIFLDEFARGTNVEEGTALISAFLEKFSGDGKVKIFLATHYLGLKSGPRVDFLTMSGFDREAYEKTKRENPGPDENLSLINRSMKYKIVREKNIRKGDALKIAGILGLDGEIIRRAEKRLKSSLRGLAARKEKR